MKMRVMSCAVMVIGVLAIGCKTNFGPGCDKAAELAAPWTELALPIDDEGTRVCEASRDKVKLRSFEWSSKNKAKSAFETALTSAGYSKDRCSNAACYYKKEDQQIGVQPMDFKVKKKKAVTVVLTRRASK